jgi:predicted XRE-type DNA-binding protein
VPNQAARHCASCGCALNHFNDTPLCGPCSRGPHLPAADDLWTTDPARLALSRWDIGTAVDLYRRFTGAKQTRIADAVGIHQSEVSRLIRGEKKIRDRQQLMTWARALGIPDHLLPTLPADELPTAVPSALWMPQVIDTLSAIGELTGTDVNHRITQAAETEAANLTKALLAWAATTTAAEPSPAAKPGRPMGTADVQTLTIMAQAFADADHRLGGGHARSTLTHYLSNVAIPLAKQADHTDPVGRQLLAEVARLSDIAGFMAFDAGQQAVGRRYLVHALRLARAADSPELGAHILTDLAMQAIHLNQAAPAVAAAEAAIAAARQGRSPSALARCFAIAARATAAAGDAAASDRHLNEAEGVLDRRDRAEEPSWISFFSHRQLTVEAMYASYALGRSSHVQRHAEAARLDLAAGDAMPRRDVLAKSTLALSYLSDGQTDVERACSLMNECLPLMGRLTSARALAAVQETRRRLADFSDSASVKHLEETFALTGQADV